MVLETLLTTNTYAEAVKKLSETKTAAPVFYTVSGINENEGIIIAKDRDYIHKKFELN